MHRDRSYVHRLDRPGGEHPVTLTTIRSHFPDSPLQSLCRNSGPQERVLPALRRQPLLLFSVSLWKSLPSLMLPQKPGKPLLFLSSSIGRWRARALAAPRRGCVSPGDRATASASRAQAAKLPGRGDLGTLGSRHVPGGSLGWRCVGLLIN